MGAPGGLPGGGRVILLLSTPLPPLHFLKGTPSGGPAPPGSGGRAPLCPRKCTRIAQERRSPRPCPMGGVGRSALPGTSQGPPGGWPLDLRLPGAYAPAMVEDRTLTILRNPFPRIASREDRVAWTLSVFGGWKSLNFIYQLPKKRRISTEYGTSMVRSPCGVLFISKVFKDLKNDGLFLSFKNPTMVNSVFFGNGYHDTQGLRWWMLECWRKDPGKVVILGGTLRRLEDYAVENYDAFQEVNIGG